jgi:hypothetical protein
MLTSDGKRNQSEMARALREQLAAAERAETDQDLALVAEVVAMVRYQDTVTPQLSGVETLLNCASARLERIRR